MKRFLLATAAAAICSASAAFAADLAVVAPPPPPSPWDIAFGAGVYSDYNFRGISQSNRKPSVNAYFEPRFNVSDNLQLYAGVGGWSIAFANRTSGEIDIYGGIRPSFGALSFDLGVWYYYYPGGQCFNTSPPGDLECLAQNTLPNGNIIKKDLSFLEYFGKASLDVTDFFSIGAGAYYDVDWLNFGFDALYASGTATLSVPSVWMPPDVGAYLSAEYGRYYLGTTDAFYGNIPLPDYSTWNVGVGLTWKVFTVDMRYYDTDLSEGECNAITSDFTASFDPAAVIPVVNPGGLASKWCNEAYVISLKADLTYNDNVK